MAEIPFDIVGFDLDGTLIDSSEDLAEATNQALSALGLPTHDIDEVKRFVGKGTRVLIERALRASGDFSEERVEAVREKWTVLYDQILVKRTRPYPGAVEVLNALRARGVRTGLCTNKGERFTYPILEKLGLIDLFDAIVCGDTVGTMKPDPAPLLAMMERSGGRRGVFLGDTSHDVDAARSAGLASIAVRFGFIDAADQLGADAILERYEALLPLLANWPGR